MMRMSGRYMRRPWGGARAPAWAVADGDRAGECVVAPAVTKEFPAAEIEPVTFSVAGAAIAPIGSRSPCP